MVQNVLFSVHLCKYHIMYFNLMGLTPDDGGRGGSHLLQHDAVAEVGGAGRVGRRVRVDDAVCTVRVLPAF